MNNFDELNVVEEDPLKASKISTEDDYWKQSKANSELYNDDGLLNDKLPQFGR